MEYQVLLSDDATYIIVRVLGVITEDKEKAFAADAIRKGKLNNIDKYLVDVRGAPSVVGSLKQYFFGSEEVDQFGLGKKSKIAIIADKDDESHHFIETGLLSAGHACRLFGKETEALKWLRG